MIEHLTIEQELVAVLKYLEGLDSRLTKRVHKYHRLEALHLLNSVLYSVRNEIQNLLVLQAKLHSHANT